MVNKKDYRKTNPYDLTQTGKIMGGRSENIKTRPPSDDPYSVASSAYEIKDDSRKQHKGR